MGEKRIDEKYILVGASAQTAKGSSVYEAYKSVSVQLLIDRETRCIVKSHFNLISPLTQEFLEECVKEHCMDDSIDPLLNRIRESVALSSAGAVIQALRNSFERYKEFVAKQ